MSKIQRKIYRKESHSISLSHEILELKVRLFLSVPWTQFLQSKVWSNTHQVSKITYVIVLALIVGTGATSTAQISVRCQAALDTKTSSPDIKNSTDNSSNNVALNRADPVRLIPSSTLPSEWSPIIAELVELVESARVPYKVISEWRQINVRSLIAEKTAELIKRFGKQSANAILTEVRNQAINNILSSAEWMHENKERTLTDSSQKPHKVKIFAPHLKKNFLHQTGEIYSALFSPDSSKTLTTSSLGIVRLWDTQTGSLLHTLHQSGVRIKSALFSPNGQSVLTIPNDYTAQLWNTKTLELITTFVGHVEEIREARFSPDGQQILTVSNDTTAKLWDVKTGKEILTLKGHDLPVSLAAFSLDGLIILTASFDKTAKLWDARTGKLLHTLAEHANSIISIAFSPDGSQVLTASFDKSAKLWDTRTGDVLYSFEGHTDWLTVAVFSPNGYQILTASQDTTAKLWDIRTRRELHTFKGHTKALESAVFSPDGLKVLTASDDSTAKLWDAQTGELLYTFDSHKNWLYSALFSPDGAQVLMASADTTATLWSLYPDIEVNGFLPE